MTSPLGKKDVIEAVAIALLSAAAVGLVERFFKKWEERDARKRKAKQRRNKTVPRKKKS